MQMKPKTEVLFFLLKPPESTLVIFVDFCEMIFGANPIVIVSNGIRNPKSSLAWLFGKQNSLGVIFSKSDVSASI